MSERVIVIVSDLDDGSHGEINVFDEPGKATELIESLLGSGFEQERIRVFHGDEMEMQVSHRPVVSLVGNENETAAEEPPEAGESEVPETEVSASSIEEPAPMTATESPVRAEIREEVTVAPFVKDGVRFSTQFKPA
jgi:hypothetical protein